MSSKKVWIIAASCLIIWAAFGATVIITSDDGRGQTDTPVTQAKVHPPAVDELLALVNKERARNGAAPLKIDDRLNSSAQMKANDEVKYGYFGHESDKSPNNRGNSRYWMIATGISCIDSSENLTQNTTVNDAAHAVNAWIASPPHHAAMINGAYDLTGFGISGNQIVEHFCQSK